MALIGSLPFTLVNGTTADATQVMADLNTIVSNVNANAAANGANADITSLTALTTPLTPAQGGSQFYTATAPSTGTANAQIITTLTPTGFTLTSGFRVSCIMGFTNTGPMTLTVNGLPAAAVSIRTANGLSALSGDECVATLVSTFEYDGAQFELLDPIPNEGLWTPAFAGTGTAGTFTYTNQIGRMWRYGNLVTIFGRVTISAIGVAPTGNLIIGGFGSGLPTPISVAGLNFPCAISQITGITFNSASYTQLAAQVIPAGGGNIQLHAVGSAQSDANIPAANLASNGDITFSATYVTA